MLTSIVLILVLGLGLGFLFDRIGLPSLLGMLLAGIMLGSNKQIPTLILASASVDDVFAITMFSLFLSFFNQQSTSVWRGMLQIPLSIISGILLGLVVGYLLYNFFNLNYYFIGNSNYDRFGW